MKEFIAFKLAQEFKYPEKYPYKVILEDIN